MALFFYHLIVFLYQTGIRLAAPFHSKARLWCDGRRGIWEKLEENIQPDQPWIWMHCSSLGEFEQGRPLLDRWRKQYPGYRILLTFFSPSGYEQRKYFKGADWVCYLPMDSPRNARRFLSIVNPRLVFFVKYDYWYYYLKTCHDRSIPLYIVSAIFRPGQPFFKWYGGLHRKMLGFFTRIFVQDKSSVDLLENRIPGLPVTIAGDTRFDRVLEIERENKVPDGILSFCQQDPILVAGSTWPADEAMLRAGLDAHPQLKLVIAPHEISENRLQSIETLFPSAIRHSQWQENKKAQVLIIDHIGSLAYLYRVAVISYVGGGFGSGIHNTLEAAVYGAPVLFGPNYTRFREAVELKKEGAGFVIQQASDMVSTLQVLLSDEAKRKEAGDRAGKYVATNGGATRIILDHLPENLRLTS